MDFVLDALLNARQIRVLSVVDDYNWEVVEQLVDFSIGGQQVARFLDKVGQERGLPTDNGIDFTCKAMHFWSMDKGVRISLYTTRETYTECVR